MNSLKINYRATKNCMDRHSRSNSRTAQGSWAVACLFFFLAMLPQFSHAEDLAKMATIHRDSYGVPHIVAQTEEAAAFAQGYATAEDHFQVLARLFLRARGEQASVFGAKYRDEDILIHKLGIWDTAQERFKDIPPVMQAILNGYAAGYNLYLSQERSRGSAPEWAIPISGIDLLAHCRAVLLLDFSLDLKPWRRPSDRIPGYGSNMWAIGRGRSHSGHGILLANPHLNWDGSRLFHEIQIQVPGKINISGAALVGFPVVTIGFNDYLGWSHTVNQHQSENVYELKLNPGNPQEYFYDGQLLPLRAKTFSIKVKVGEAVQTQSETALWSHYGPVISVEGGKAYAYKSPNLNSVNFLTQYNLMAKARSWKEFRAALNIQELTMFNVGYADRDGNIFYLYNGRFPIRPEGYDWMKAVPGDDSKAEWYAIQPVSELPQIFDPPSGYIQNCNDAPWYVNAKDPIDRKNYPDYTGDQSLGLRGQISLQMLEASSNLTLEDVKQDKFNERVLLADRLKSELIELAKQNAGTAPELPEIIDVLQKWDNKTSVDSKGAVLFQHWFEEYSHKAGPVYKMKWNQEHPYTTPSGIGDPKIALATLLAASSWTKEKFHDLAVSWGEVHRLKRGNLDLPIGGMTGMGTFRSIVYRKDDKDEKWNAVAGDSYVLAVEFTSPPTAFSVSAYSESSDPKSKHYNDQSTLFARAAYKPVWSTQEDIKNHLERSYHPGE